MPEFKIMLITDSDTKTCRDFCAGIMRYSQLHGPWATLRISASAENELCRARRNGYHAVISFCECPQHEIDDSRMPAVINISDSQNRHLSCNVSVDDNAIGKMAAEFLVGLKFRHFGFCGFSETWSQGRGAGFSSRLRDMGFANSCLDLSDCRTCSEEDYRVKIINWLESLAKPVGILSCNDKYGRYIIESCERTGLEVPTDVAIIGAENDEMMCYSSVPSLSSISLNYELAGYETAHLLEDLTFGIKPRQKCITIPPADVIARQSTDVIPVNDPTLATAMRFIRQHAANLICVTDVADAVMVSRRNLERNFRKTFNTSVYKEIRRTRVDQIAKMLAQTKLPVSRIASSLGYRGAHHINRYFREEKGMNVRDYRKQFGMHN